MQKSIFTDSRSALLSRRVAFVLEAFEDEAADLCAEMLASRDPYRQELLWSHWIEYFFSKGGKITWQGFASVPIMIQLCLQESWQHRRMVLEYLVFWAGKVEEIYFFYDYPREASFTAEDERWSEVSNREICRPWLRMAFHAFRAHAHVFEQVLAQKKKGEEVAALHILWHCLKMGKVSLSDETQKSMQDWWDLTKPAMLSSDQNQLGLFG